MKLTRIRLVYHLTVPADRWDDVERVKGFFERGCPIAQTLKGCVTFEHEWNIREA